MVSPAADRYPEKTLYTNIGSTLNIIKAIKEQPDPDKVHFAYVGVAIFAQMENMDYTQAVKDICLSTILCIVTIPLIVTAAGKLL